MANNRDHHHLPQFHFVPWENADHMVMRWGRVAHNGKLTHQLKSPRGTAYITNLYARKLVHDDQVHAVESNVFGRLEDRAVVARDKILATGLDSLTNDERQTWGIYVNALAFRTPEALQMARNKAPYALDHMVEQLGHLYPALRGNNPEATAKEWLENHRAGELANAGLDAIVMNIVSGGWTVQRILALSWCTVDLSAATSRLLLSDRPLIRDNALQDPRVVLALPISPTTLWMACETEDVIAHLLRMQAQELVSATNSVSCLKAKQFVYGEANRAFVDHWLLKPDTVSPAA